MNDPITHSRTNASSSHIPQTPSSNNNRVAFPATPGSAPRGTLFPETPASGGTRRTSLTMRATPSPRNSSSFSTPAHRGPTPSPRNSFTPGHRGSPSLSLHRRASTASLSSNNSNGEVHLGSAGSHSRQSSISSQADRELSLCSSPLIFWSDLFFRS